MRRPRTLRAAAKPQYTADKLAAEAAERIQKIRDSEAVELLVAQKKICVAIKEPLSAACSGTGAFDALKAREDETAGVVTNTSNRKQRYRLVR